MRDWAPGVFGTQGLTQGSCSANPTCHPPLLGTPPALSITLTQPHLPASQPTLPTALPTPLASRCRQVPCDPKMLLPPLDRAELAGFQLTSVEREMKRDMLFEPDLGIPISMLDIERYAIPYAGPHDKPPLHPKDEELLRVGAPRRAMPA